MKSFLIKIAIMILSLAIFPIPAFAQQKTPQAPTPNGRYQIFFSPHLRADTFLVDTMTGRVWQMTTYTDIEGKPTVWENMDRIDDDRSLQDFVHKYKKSNPPTENSQ